MNHLSRILGLGLRTGNNSAVPCVYAAHSDCKVQVMQLSPKLGVQYNAPNSMIAELNKHGCSLSNNSSHLARKSFLPSVLSKGSSISNNRAMTLYTLPSIAV